MAAPFPFDTETDGRVLAGLKHRGGRNDTQFIQPGLGLGSLRVRCQSSDGSIAELDEPLVSGEPTQGLQPTWQRHVGPVRVESAFVPSGDQLQWRIDLHNTSDQQAELLDLAFPIPMNSAFAWDKPATESVLRHSLLSLEGSFLFWMRPDSMGPFLLMTPMPGTGLEFFENLEVDKAGTVVRLFIHAKGQGAAAKNWRLPLSSAVLAPGERRSYGFRLEWAEDYAEVRQKLVERGGFDVRVVPGMTIPVGTEVQLRVRTQGALQVQTEHPSGTVVAEQKEGFSVCFDRLGENKLTLVREDGARLVLEFFVTEPMETMVEKRAAFLAKCQHNDPSKWYRGLISDWNMETGVLLGPDNYDRIMGWRIYAVSCDDPGLGKPAFLAAKNAELPVQNEIEALERYVEGFVWGGLQCTDDEAYPFGIYGIPDWKTLRESDDPGPKGQTHLWRIYDYPHIVLLYLSLYKASFHTSVRLKQDPLEYLRRAWGTAVAMFTVPMAIQEWSAYQTGLYNELCIVDLLDALESVGWSEKAGELRGHWERKVRAFVAENPNLFGSEYPFDSTGFESTYAFAFYAKEHMPELADQAREFMDRQRDANVFCRGWLETAYYLYGSDYRAIGNTAYTLSYMAAMGGWSLLEQALFYDPNPWEMLRLGYASILSSWALLNSGTEESDYGYWYPGKHNDGAAGGGFEPAPYGTTWLEQPHTRGSWYYSCEIDLGYCAYLRAARTVLAEDPLFGRLAFGGRLEQNAGVSRVWPEDGVRRRVSWIWQNGRLHVDLVGARFVSQNPVVCQEGKVRFEVEQTWEHPIVRLRGTVGTTRINGVGAEVAADRWVECEIGPSSEVVLEW